MSPKVVQPRPFGSREAFVFSGSLWYSNWAFDSKYTVPDSPVGSSFPSSSQICMTAFSDWPTVPWWASQDSELQ